MSMHRINGGAGPEIVPTTRDFPWWLRDLVLAAVITSGLASLSVLLDRWERLHEQEQQAEQLRLRNAVAACRRLT